MSDDESSDNSTTTTTSTAASTTAVVSSYRRSSAKRKKPEKSNSPAAKGANLSRMKDEDIKNRLVSQLKTFEKVAMYLPDRGALLIANVEALKAELRRRRLEVFANFHALVEEVLKSDPAVIRRACRIMEDVLHCEKNHIPYPPCRGKPDIGKSTRRNPSAFEYGCGRIRDSMSTKDYARSGSSSSSLGLDIGFRSNVNPRMRTDLFPWFDDVPDFIIPYITGWRNVVSDGNCGFRVIAEAGYGSEDYWDLVRSVMVNEIKAHAAQYVAMYGYKDGQQEAMHRIGGHMQESTKHNCRHWLETPSDLYSAATYLNLVILNLSTVKGDNGHVIEGCVSIFPLRARADVRGPKRVIGIAYADKKHYVLVHLHDGCPLPPLDFRWANARHSSVVGWEEPFADRFAVWRSLRELRRGGV